MRPASCVYWMTYLVLSLIAATLTTLQLRILRDVMEKLTAGIFRYAKKIKTTNLDRCIIVLFCSQGVAVCFVPVLWCT